MSWKTATMAVLLLTAGVLRASTVRAEDDPAAKAAHDKAVRSYDAANDKLEAAQERLKAAELKLQAASAETKQAAQNAVDAAKRAVEAAGSEAGAKANQARSAVERLVGATGQKLGQAKDALGRAKATATGEAHEARAEAHAATDKAVASAVDKANALKAGVEAATVEAKQEAQVAMEHADETVHRVQAVAHQVVSDAIGSTSKGARLRMARRAAWRWLAGDIDKPENLPPSVREELKRHAQRIARLQRIRVLANEKPDTALIKRADALIERENTRHQAKLQTLLAGAHAKRMTNDRIRTAAEDEPDPAEETVEEEEEQP